MYITRECLECVNNRCVKHDSADNAKFSIKEHVKYVDGNNVRESKGSKTCGKHVSTNSAEGEKTGRVAPCMNMEGLCGQAAKTREVTEYRDADILRLEECEVYCVEDLNVENKEKLYPEGGACKQGASPENCWNKVYLNQLVMQNGYPNAWGARIPVESGWNITLLKSLLKEYHDKDICDWLTYGWPISRPPTWPDPTPTFNNHSSAVNNPAAINAYIEKEIHRGGVCGPFFGVPFNNRVGVSPLSTRDKKDSEEKRILMDLSWPINNSVNSGIAKDQFMGFLAKLSFPTIDSIARRIAGMRGEVMLFKIDLAAYFRQLPLDPGDYSLMCFSWDGCIFFDIVSPMGLRSAPYFAQRTSNALRYIHNQMGYYLFNYIDDFIGVELKGAIWNSFLAFRRLLKDLGVKESRDKAEEPTHVLNCVGTLVNARDRTLSVLPGRKEELMNELAEWRHKDTCSLKDVQRLVGKLQFICAVVRPGRIFLGRMLEFLRNLYHEGRARIPTEFHKDIEWWYKFLPKFEGTGILWMYHIKEPDHVAASDSSLVGMGAVSGREFVKLKFPPEVTSNNIAHLELLAVIVMVKVWLHKFRHKSVIFRCDNEAVCRVLNSGKARDPTLLKYLRELVYIAAGKFEFRAVHIRSELNTLPDLLSRWEHNHRIREKFYELVKGKGYKEIEIAPNICYMSHNW